MLHFLKLVQPGTVNRKLPFADVKPQGGPDFWHFTFVGSGFTCCTPWLLSRLRVRPREERKT